MRCIYLLVRLCIAYTELMNMYNKIFNPLCLFVGVGDWEIYVNIKPSLHNYKLGQFQYFQDDLKPCLPE